MTSVGGTWLTVAGRRVGQKDIRLHAVPRVEADVHRRGSLEFEAWAVKRGEKKKKCGFGQQDVELGAPLATVGQHLEPLANGQGPTGGTQPPCAIASTQN